MAAPLGRAARVGRCIAPAPRHLAARSSWLSAAACDIDLPTRRGALLQRRLLHLGGDKALGVDLVAMNRAVVR